MSLKKSFIWSLVLLFLSFSPVSAQSQIPPELLTRGAQNYPSTLQTLEKPEEQILDKPVDPQEYRVGPGDVLLLTLLGEISYDYTLTINPEGGLVIPTVGILDTKDLTLAELKERIIRKVLEHYVNVDVNVSLTKVRKFKVSVVGEVKNPGSFSASATDRVFEVIQKAGDLSTQSSQRNIQIKRGNEVLIADVLKFMNSGDKKNNPYVLEGDVIYVPIKDANIFTCGVYGAVKSPQQFEYNPFDKLRDLIYLAGGLTFDADSNTAEVVRFKPDHKTTYSFNVNLKAALLDSLSPDNIQILPDDRIFIRFIPAFHQKSTVFATGEVNSPGAYAVKENGTRLSEVISMAGGFTPSASLVEAEIFRNTVTDNLNLEWERIKELPAGQLSDIEYKYYKSQPRQKAGKISCDFVKLFNHQDKNEDVVLQDRDSIWIPALTPSVNVSGQVSLPGFVSFKSGQDYKYYVKEAGGYAWKADKGNTMVIKRNAGIWVKATSRERIYPGDAIWVPEKSKGKFWVTIKDAALFVGNIATLYLVIREATK